jgi:hypothetical protein
MAAGRKANLPFLVAVGIAFLLVGVVLALAVLKLAAGH